ncbi:MAG: hypothetical protein ACRBFS_26400 [Aureispira sp.]
MKIITLLFLSLLVLYSCEEKELIESTPSSTSQVIEKSASGNEYADNADFSQQINSEEDLEQMLSMLDDSKDNILVVEHSVAYVFYELAPVWFDPTTIDGKKICKGLGGIAFGKCVYKHIKAGEKVLVWIDANGNLNASI